MKIELVNEAAQAIERIRMITERELDEVLSDALRTYLWVLREQTNGRKVVSMDGAPESQTTVENLVRDRKAAEQYFKELGW